MGNVVRVFLVAAVTVCGALIAWPLLLHRGWAWLLVGTAAAIVLLGAAGFVWTAARLGRDPVKYLAGLEWTTAAIPIAVGLLAATLIAWITGRCGPGDGRLHADLGVGLGGITAAATVAFVDSLKDGGARGSRIRAVFKRAFLERLQALPDANPNKNRWELSLSSPAQAANWATAADRKDRAADFATVPASDPAVIGPS